MAQRLGINGFHPLNFLIETNKNVRCIYLK